MRCTSNDSHQSVEVSVSLQNGRHINIVAIYCPPQAIWSGQDFNNLLTSLGDAFIVGGDWNAKSQWWGNARSCLRGRTLVNSILQVNCNILATGSPTHYPFNSRQTPSAIDFALFKGIRRELLAITDSFELSSDHLPLQVQLVEKPTTNNAKGHLLHLNANINKFQSYLNDKILLNTEINSADDVDDAVNIFVKNIEDAANYANPQNPRKLTRTRFRVNRQTLLLIEARKQIKRYLLRNRNPLAKQLYNRLSNRIRKELIVARQMYEEELFKSIDPTDRYSMQKLWRLTNEIKRQPAPNLPLLKSSSGNGSNAHNVWCKTTAEKVETFAASLEQRFHPIVTTSPSDLAEIEAQVSQPSVTPSVLFRPVTAAEVISHISTLENKKAAGLDQIDNHTIKALPMKAILSYPDPPRNSNGNRRNNDPPIDLAAHTPASGVAQNIGDAAALHSRLPIFQELAPSPPTTASMRPPVINLDDLPD
ncbi:hypothetical protein AWZ03_014546 [Drosophila navojoa]|uniref:Endonuclease/exonuclease/phosphatase domain-containing protein n=1 Tax=Drosophila navojoa TaxID=7232 RepID=A0A484ATU9_DRONA|nr:hypothetical protein AWZ03_014546 [Drosophila navojoa]